MKLVAPCALRPGPGVKPPPATLDPPATYRQVPGRNKKRVSVAAVSRLASSFYRQPYRCRLRRCVFAAGLLCVCAFCSALLVLQASDACPGALQIIAYCDVQRAAALTGELDVVAVHERIEPSMIGAGCENVAGVQRVNRGDPFNAARNLMRHVISVEILHDDTVVC